MTLNQLTYFCMLAKTQSYTQAAQALFIAQPSLSYAISTLEKELGCLLVAREGRRISLTPAGETFYRYAKAALEAIAQGVQAVQCGGVIRLGAIATAMAEHIPKLVVDFRAEHPQTTINVSVAASGNGIIHSIPQRIERFYGLMNYLYLFLAAKIDKIVADTKFISDHSF